MSRKYFQLSQLGLMPVGGALLGLLPVYLLGINKTWAAVSSQGVLRRSPENPLNKPWIPYQITFPHPPRFNAKPMCPLHSNLPHPNRCLLSASGIEHNGPGANMPRNDIRADFGGHSCQLFRLRAAHANQNKFYVPVPG